MYTTECVKTASAIPKDQWDKLAASVYQSHGWHLLMEDEPIIPIHPRHIVVRNEKSIVGIATCYIHHDDLYSNLQHFLLGKRQNVVPLKINPCLLCYSPLNLTENGNGLLLEKSISKHEKTQIISCIAQELNRIALEEGLTTYGFLNMSKKDSVMQEELTKNSFSSSFTGYIAGSAISENDWEKFLYTLKKKKRKVIRRDLRENERNKISVSMHADLTPFADVLLNLFEQTFRKHNHTKFKLTKSFLVKAQKHLQDSIALFVAKRNDTYLGAVLNFRFKDRWDSFVPGHDYAKIKKEYNSFVLLLDEPMKQAVSRGYKRMSFGTGSYVYKVQRGLHLEPSHLYLKSTSKVKNCALKLLLFHFNRKMLKKHNKSFTTRGETNGKGGEHE